MTSTTTDILGAYTRRADPFSAVVDRVPDDGWDRPSPCEGWNARDVLAHVVTSQRQFLAQRGFDATTAHPLDIDDPAGHATDPRAAWHAHDERMRELLADPSVTGHEYDGVFGRTTVGQSIVAFHGFDLVVHRWDLAAAAGLDERLTDDELDMVERSADGFGEHLYDDGVCGPAVPVADDAERQERMLARLGRRTPANA
ncbi:TIGR03086 family metal-binding protein [Terrabacter carboxydivorans]|uniref:Maleylpyruvate isomerase family mycothiol-dependent enzyme n=1 Tax=Terrabacter carboxydivorans TaxID=619730 RepID=A0ABN3LHG4_9MICO